MHHAIQVNAYFPFHQGNYRLFFRNVFHLLTKHTRQEKSVLYVFCVHWQPDENCSIQNFYFSSPFLSNLLWTHSLPWFWFFIESFFERCLNGKPIHIIFQSIHWMHLTDCIGQHDERETAKIEEKKTAKTFTDAIKWWTKHTQSLSECNGKKIPFTSFETTQWPTVLHTKTRQIPVPENENE